MKKFLLLFFLLAFLPTIAQDEPAADPNETIDVEPGKQMIFVVSVIGEKDNDASPLLAKRETSELKKNFPECDVRLIDQMCRVHFLNKADERMAFNDKKTTYEHVIYWDGKKASAIKVSPIRTKLTEFISSVTGKKKTSSYLSDNQKIFDTIAQRKKVLNPNADSKKLAQFYSLNMLYNQRLYGDIWYDPLANQDYSKVKRATVFMSRNGQPEAEAFKVNFNDQHLVENISYSKRPGSDNTVFFIFSYDNNGLLRKMVSTDDFDKQARVHTYEYTYDGNLLIETSDDEISEIYIQDGMLMQSRNYEFTNYEKNFLVENAKTVMEDSCKIEYRNGLKNESYCASGDGTETPYVYEKTLYDNGNPARVSTSQIVRDGNKLTVSNKVHDEYRQVASVLLNKYGLIQSVDGGQSKGVTYHLRVDYKYFD